ncbi:preprotein translocase subunit YajC [Lactiplantibacillus plajomi]|uniref:Preprotein translocase subunit YajC n=1 Tax=Lactiplantibacillus plajomi TaxID=1457217 RepID=A0ABV6K6N5_9LACO|nr:preprotein translocase subunit YajC [Lactiplantibacillus plajomi]
MTNMASIIFIVAMFAFLYFFMIRPQRKQQQQHQSMLSKIKRGDKVTTIGRLHGVVDEVNEADKTITLDCDGIYLVFDLNAIAKITPAETAEKPATSAAASTEAGSDEAASADATEADSAADSAASEADSSAADSEAK